MIKKRLTPGLMAMLAMTVPLAISVKANAETGEGHPQTTEVLTVETNQPEQENPVKSNANENSASYPSVVPIVLERESNQFSPLAKVVTPNLGSVSDPTLLLPKPKIIPITAQFPPTEISQIPTAQYNPENRNLSTAVPTSLDNGSVLLPKPAIIPITTQVPPVKISQIPTAESSPENPDPSAAPSTSVDSESEAEMTQPSGAEFSPENPNPSTAPPTSVDSESEAEMTQPPGAESSPENPNPSTAPPPASPTPEATESRVLVSEVVIRSEKGEVTPELESEVYKVIRTQAGQTTTRSQLQEDISAIFRTGFFSNVQAFPEDTPLGVRVSFVVAPNPILSKVELEANPGTDVASVLPAETATEIFGSQYGKILNLRELNEGIKQLTKRYQDQGYVLANLIGAPKVSEDGVVTLQVAEGIVESVKVRFRNKDGEDVDEKGNPIRGRTKEYIITRELELKPGTVFNRNTVQQDLARIYGLGLFEPPDAEPVSLAPGSDPSRVNVIVNVTERNSGSIAAGAGISSASGLFGTVSYQQQNLGGRNQKLGAEVQVGERELLFDLRFTDPWIAGDPYRTSYTTNIFRRRSISLIFEGKDQNIDTFDPGNVTDTDQQDRPRITRLGGGITFTRPLSRNPFKSSEWLASAGLQYQRISGRDADGNLRKEGAIFDDAGNQISETTPLTLSSSGEDDLLLLKLGAQRDLRNNSLQPTSGSYLRFGVDQSVPIGTGSIFMTRLRANYSRYLPIKLLSFSKKPETLAFNVQGGTIFGDLPPYEAFTLGGSNSVRGYEEGRLGTGKSYLQAAVEYRFPVFSVVSGALFFDYGSDLGTSTKAAQLLNKNGDGYGYGLGLRIQSPLGPIRIDYGITDEGDSRINFGIGERF
jgi:outer membrane protein insertion porin family